MVIGGFFKMIEPCVPVPESGQSSFSLSALVSRKIVFRFQ